MERKPFNNHTNKCGIITTRRYAWYKGLLKCPVSEMEPVILLCACSLQDPPSHGDTTLLIFQRKSQGVPWIFLQFNVPSLVSWSAAFILCLAFLEWQCNRCSQPIVMIAYDHNLRSCNGIKQKHLLYGPEIPTSGDSLLRATLHWPVHKHPL